MITLPFGYTSRVRTGPFSTITPRVIYSIGTDHRAASMDAWTHTPRFPQPARRGPHFELLLDGELILVDACSHVDYWCPSHLATLNTHQPGTISQQKKWTGKIKDVDADSRVCDATRANTNGETERESRFAWLGTRIARSASQPTNQGARATVLTDPGWLLGSFPGWLQLEHTRSQCVRAKLLALVALEECTTR